MSILFTNENRINKRVLDVLGDGLDISERNKLDIYKVN